MRNISCSATNANKLRNRASAMIMQSAEKEDWNMIGYYLQG